jgi:serine-type D-Ala-D-Ala carboxypeptidase/endopeptidase (penicillin-binding protein 4)
MKRRLDILILIAVLAASSARPSAAAPAPAQAKAKAKAKPAAPARPAKKDKGAPAAPAPAPPAEEAAVEEEAPPPADNDPDRERIQRLQEALTSIVHGPVLGRTRVGMRVMELDTGRLLFARRGSALMDPASNQKVLATAAALLRLGSGWRFRTELAGAAPDEDGVIGGDVVLRGTGDPSLRATHLDQMAAELAVRGVTKIAGAVLADARRIGAAESAADERSPLRVGRSAIEVRVRPGSKDGAAPVVTVLPETPAIVVENRGTTRGKGKSRIAVKLASAGNRIKVMISGRLPARHPGLLVRRLAPNQTLFSAVLLRAAFAHAGIEVIGAAGLYAPSRGREPRRTAAAPASAAAGSDTKIALDPPNRPAVLAIHESDPLPVLMRRINKDSDNEWAERLLESVGAEIYGGPATPAKGIRALREAVTDLGLPPAAYVPTNGSGLGHSNRITPDAMADLLRTLFLDPRLGPDMLQSLSVGGVDGTIRNRFRGSPAAERVRAKTGTLKGKSCLSGYVGDGADILVFSIMVDKLRPRTLTSVRHAQVNAVNAMMRYARGAVGPAPGEEVAPGVDYEVGDELVEGESEDTDQAPPTPPTPPAGPAAAPAAAAGAKQPAVVTPAPPAQKVN